MNFFREIVEKLGYDSYIKGRVYPRNYIKNVDRVLGEDKYIHTYKVKSQRTRNFYDVKILNNGGTIYELDCNCKQFKNMNTCKHIAAILINEFDEIAKYEYIDELEVSEDILDEYFSSTKEIKAKKKVNLNVEFSFDHDNIMFKLLVGESHLYTLSTEAKLKDFLEALEENYEFEFGKKFVYNPNEYYFDSKDLEILRFVSDYEKIKSNNYYYRPNPFELSSREFESLLKTFDGKIFSIKGLGIINQINHGMPTNFQLQLEDNNYKLIIDDFKEYQFLDDDKRYVVYNHEFYLLSNEDSKYLKLLDQNKVNNVTFEKKHLQKFGNGLFKKIKNKIDIAEDITDIVLPTKPDTKLYFDILYSSLTCSVIFDYKGNEVNYFEKSQVLRDNEAEEEVILDLISYGLYEKNKKFVIEDTDLMYEFIDEILPSLSEKYNIFTSKKIDNTSIMKKMNANSNFSIGKDGIMSYQFNVDGINQDELNGLFSALKAKKKYYKLKNNNVVSIQNNEALENLNDLITDLEFSNGDITNGTAEIPKYRALYIDSLKTHKYKNIKTNNLFDEFINNFQKYKDIEIKLDKSDEKILRDYQKEGVKWLTTIYKCDFGGILADEMGLGKSFQTICFIKQVLKEKKDAKIMIVAPTSLIYNWQKEFEKFASNLKYVVVAENKQRRKEILNVKDKYNIFITTYGLIRNDNDEYEDMNFELCVIDEAQTIKNYQANMTKEVKKIKARCKIALTGTPVENNVTELWSIFDFIMPGYLNTILKFKDKYNIKDVDETGIQVLKKLNYQINPFILRRKKIDVAKSLPDKIENKVYIDLPEKQKMLYLKVLNDTKREMDEIIQNEGFQKSRMKVLQLLMKLRQICIDPSVMFENYDGESAKIEELLRIVKENIENGHKILIFSSFKRVLDNVRNLFKNHSISNYMIDGSVKSKERMDMVEAFNKDNTNCFLITLKSGGTGLNLVGADVVLHLDIWWNPQVENQATDRAHRIGQTKKVTVVKIITKGTIEERIVELQEKKKILSENLIEGRQDSENLSELTEKDIRKLLSYTED